MDRQGTTIMNCICAWGGPGPCPCPHNPLRPLQPQVGQITLPGPLVYPGCICPPTSEQTRQNPNCPRKAKA
jgi:hypothetical protein